jgi:acyl-coenzyme A synthetase/AMP-(fatty) acid ligase
VVLEDGVSTVNEPNIREALFTHAAEHLVKYKRPREIHFRTELPRNALGKIIRSELQIST